MTNGTRSKEITNRISWSMIEGVGNLIEWVK